MKLLANEVSHKVQAELNYCTNELGTVRIWRKVSNKTGNQVWHQIMHITGQIKGTIDEIS